MKKGIVFIMVLFFIIGCGDQREKQKKQIAQAKKKLQQKKKKQQQENQQTNPSPQKIEKEELFKALIKKDYMSIKKNMAFEKKYAGNKTVKYIVGAGVCPKCREKINTLSLSPLAKTPMAGYYCMKDSKYWLERKDQEDSSLWYGAFDLDSSMIKAKFPNQTPEKKQSQPTAKNFIEIIKQHYLEMKKDMSFDQKPAGKISGNCPKCKGKIKQKIIDSPRSYTLISMEAFYCEKDSCYWLRHVQGGFAGDVTRWYGPFFPAKK